MPFSRSPMGLEPEGAGAKRAFGRGSLRATGAPSVGGWVDRTGFHSSTRVPRGIRHLFHPFLGAIPSMRYKSFALRLSASRPNSKPNESGPSCPEFVGGR